MQMSTTHNAIYFWLDLSSIAFSAQQSGVLRGGARRDFQPIHFNIAHSCPPVQWNENGSFQKKNFCRRRLEKTQHVLYFRKVCAWRISNMILRGISRISKICKISNISKIRKISNISKSSKISKITKISKISNISKIGSFSKISSISKISKII